MKKFQQEFATEVNQKSFSAKQKKWLEEFDQRTAVAQKNLTKVGETADKHFERLGQDAKGLGQDFKEVSKVIG